MKKIYVLGLFALAQCIPAEAQQTNLLLTHAQKDPWRYLEHQLIGRPSATVKSCFERKFNIGAAFLVWASTMFSGASQWYFDRLYTKVDEEYRNKRRLQLLDQENAELHTQNDVAQHSAHVARYNAYASTAWSLLKATCVASCLVTAWALYRNFFSLVTKAEEKQLAELLDNWQYRRQYIPEDLHEIFQATLALRTTNPAEFDRQAPEFIKTLKQEIQARLKEPNFAETTYQFNNQMQPIIDSLGSENTVCIERTRLPIDSV